MGRRERPIDVGAGPVAAFAAELRHLRKRAGNPTYRQLSERTHYAPSVLSAAARGARLPTWPVAHAFVQACGGEVQGWRERWRNVCDAVHPPLVGMPPAGTDQGWADGQARRPVPRQLPRAVAQFTGRAVELARLTRILDRAAEPATPLAISAVGGMGGIGKTCLAVHWAHAHATRYPDGQLFVNLRGFDASASPLPAQDALNGFLIALGVDPTAIPAGLEARGALYRSLVADKRMLVVLDNAADTDQVAALLPGGMQCAVLITSRLRLDGLVTAHGAVPLELDALPHEEAEQLLARRLGSERLATEPAAAAELLAYCAGLPLAVSILAARAAAHPDFPLTVLADELRDHVSRLDALDGGDAASSFRAVLSWSHRALGDEAARMFTLLALAPGPEIGLAAAASLAALPQPRARALLRDLEAAHLLAQPQPGRYRMHDLIRLYATEQAHNALSSSACRAAQRRVAHFYLHTAHHAGLHLYPQRPPLALGEPATGCHPLRPGNPGEALAWMDSEYPNLQALHHHAVERDRHELVWQLAWTLGTYRVRRGLVHGHLAAWRAALAAAAHLGEDPERATITHRSYGAACVRAGDQAEGLDHLTRALTLAEQADDPLNQAHAHFLLALACSARGDDEQALKHALGALHLFQSLDDPVWHVQALNAAADYAARSGHHEQALAHGRAALALAHSQHQPDGEADALANLGYLAQRTGETAQSLTHYRRALTLYRHLGNANFEASALEQLGHTYTALGQHGQARHAWHEALRIYREQHRLTDANRIEQHTALLHPGT